MRIKRTPPAGPRKKSVLCNCGQGKLTHGYTLVEALVSIVIVLFGVAAAASLSLTIGTQEEVNAKVTRALNWHENAVRLYQLGLDPEEIVGILPPLSPEATLEFNVNNDYSDFDTVPVVTSTLTFHANVDGEVVKRTNDIVVMRSLY